MTTYSFTGPEYDSFPTADIPVASTSDYYEVTVHEPLTFSARSTRLGKRIMKWLVAHSGPESTPDSLNEQYAYAAQVEPDELWRYPGNAGRPQDAGYIETSRHVREAVVDYFETGTLYETPESFMASLQNIHRIANGTGDYARLNGNHRLLTPGLTGEFRSVGTLQNDRIEDAQRVSMIAERYNDPYNQDGHLNRGRPGRKTVHDFHLEGVNDAYAACEIITYGEKGSREGRGIFSTGYMYLYPDGQVLPEYMTQMQKLGKQIESAIKTGRQDDDIVDMIAKQYQYGAHARPFAQINNSLFMHLANAQLKMLGYKGMTHGNMDIVAQRFQPETFATYFADRLEHAQSES